MATNVDPNSEVIFKEEVEEKEIKGEGASEENTIRFYFPAMEIQERYIRRAIRAVRTEESEIAMHLKAMGVLTCFFQMSFLEWVWSHLPTPTAGELGC